MGCGTELQRRGAESDYGRRWPLFLCQLFVLLSAFGETTMSMIDQVDTLPAFWQ